MRLLPDQVVDGRYRMIERIGSGGMADVWKAHDAELGRDVAIKVLHENFARDTQFVARFRQEASSAAGLQHPNVVSVYDRGEWEGTYYIAMELIEGSSLRDLINRGLEPSEAVEVARQVLAAASFAHARGIVHRDLKPLNVLIDRSGRIRVTDFGIARAGNSEITQTGSVMGTAQYLSPEQAQGMEVGPPGDIYAIGVMLFEMLTGRVPFEGENAVAIAMKQVAEQPPAPSTINPKVTPALDAVVLKALAKDPAERYATADEMIKALDAAEASPGHTETFAAMVAEEEGERRKLNAKVVALILALLLAAGGARLLPDPPGDGRRAGRHRAAGAGGDRGASGRRLRGRVRGGAERRHGGDRDRAGPARRHRGRGRIDGDDRGQPRPRDGRRAEARGQARGGGTEAARGSRLRGRHQPPVVFQRGLRAGDRHESGPQGTELGVGETVELIVSTGVATENVPNVLGLDRIDAEEQLEELGFDVQARQRDSDEPADTVISQNPTSGEAEVGSTVTIVYSSGVGTINLDNYVGQDADSAEAELEGLELNVTIIEDTVDDESQDGIVLDQAPTVNTKLSPGDRVTLTVGVFVEPPPEEETTTDRRRPTSRRREGRGPARRPLQRAPRLAALGRRRRRGAAGGRPRGGRRGDRARRALARRRRGGGVSAPPGACSAATPPSRCSTAPSARTGPCRACSRTSTSPTSGPGCWRPR